MAAELHIRLARLDEAARVREIEDLAGELYAEVGMPDDLPGLERETIEGATREQLLWVWARTSDDVAMAFALCWQRPATMHLRELGVHPAIARRGLGRALIEHVCHEARARALGAVSLTTFRDPPWNAPYYAARCGFAPLAPPELPTWLEAIRRDEREAGLDRWPRLAMWRALGG
ncbi:MAG: GNAT family N-acetyltransferase [Myxococcales bacterium]|nr:GNAT family N-acetyltransferase [Myxococcales bacterium]